MKTKRRDSLEIPRLSIFEMKNSLQREYVLFFMNIEHIAKKENLMQKQKLNFRPYLKIYKAYIYELSLSLDACLDCEINEKSKNKIEKKKTEL